MNDLLRLPYRVCAVSAPDALEAAKAAARADGFVIKGVGRVDFAKVGEWIVVLTVRPKAEVAS